MNQNGSDTFALENKPHRCHIKIVIPVRICISWLRTLLPFVCSYVHKQHVIQCFDLVVLMLQRHVTDKFYIYQGCFYSAVSEVSSYHIEALKYMLLMYEGACVHIFSGKGITSVWVDLLCFFFFFAFPFSFLRFHIFVFRFSLFSFLFCVCIFSCVWIQSFVFAFSFAVLFCVSRPQY